MSKQSSAQEKENVLQKKRKKANEKGGKRPFTATDQLHADGQLLQQTMGNQAMGQALGGNGVQREADEMGHDAFGVDQIASRPVQSSATQSSTIQRVGTPRRIDVKSTPAAGDLGHGATAAGAAPVTDQNVANQMELDSLRTMSPNFAASEKDAGKWNKLADAVGIGAPVLAAVITVATGGVGAPAAQIVNTVSKGLTILFKEMEKQGLMGEISALERMIRYIPDGDTSQYLAFKARINEYVGKIKRADVKELKSFISLFEPPLMPIAGTAEFAASLIYKKKIEAETAKAAKANMGSSQILERMQDRDVQRRQQQGEFVPLGEMRDQDQRTTAVDSAHTKPTRWQKVKNALPGKGKVHPVQQQSVQRTREQQTSAMSGVEQILTRPIMQTSGETAVQRLTDKEKRDREIKQKIQAGNKKRHNEKHGWFGSETWSGKAAGMLGYGSSKREADGDMAAHEKEETVGSWDEKEQDKIEADDKADEAAIFDIKKITINLKEAEQEKTGAYGSAKAKGGLQANIEGVEGEAELEAQLGGGGKFVDKDFGWKVSNGKLGVKAEAEGFLGAKAGAKGKAGVKYDKEKGYSAAAKGKASAFAGGELAGNTQVNIQAGGKVLASATGKLGVTWGVGGEFQFNVSWEGGTFSAGGKAKAAAGWGFSAGYSVEINTQTIASKLWGWIKNYWSASE